MTDNITVRGFVASEIRSSTTPGGVATASFRLGSTDRRYDRANSTWVDGNTNWFTVQGYRQLAGNMGCSIKKGQRVIIVGRLKMRSWEKDGRTYHSAEIDAESVGHDLMWGSANFTRTAGNAPQSAAAAADEVTGGHGSDADTSGRSGPAGEGEEDDEDNDAAESAVFIDDASGDTLQLDSETGELTGAAA
ncbi:single-stranded DNA-binding protein [Arthrobacter sp. NPDC093139]|uniref:single-stranded DNA-binding protein n=1 Tax=Arthrobacter sp. NPDC093139 TaxID=3363945 RepID=UPI0037FB56B4